MFEVQSVSQFSMLVNVFRVRGGVVPCNSGRWLMLYGDRKLASTRSWSLVMIFVIRCIMTPLLQQAWLSDFWPKWNIASSRQNVYLNWKRELKCAVTNPLAACGTECQSSERHTKSICT